MKRIWTTLLLAPAGCLGFALCYWTNLSAYDPLTRLILPGAVSLLVLKAFTAAAAAAALLIARLLRQARPQPDWSTLYGKAPLPLSLLGCAAGVLFLAGALGMTSGNLTPLLAQWDPIRLFGTLAGLFLVGAAVSMLWLSVAAGRGAAQRDSLLPLVIGFSICLWLILFYHDNAQDPVVAHFGWQLLAMSVSVLACYYHACLSFDRPRPLRCRVLTALAAVYSLTALPAAQTIPQFLLMAGLALWMLQRSFLVLGGKPARA